MMLFSNLERESINSDHIMSGLAEFTLLEMGTILGPTQAVKALPGGMSLVKNKK